MRTWLTADVSPDDPASGIAEAVRLRKRYADGAIVIGWVKGYVAGVIKSHTAAMVAPYSDDPALGPGRARLRGGDRGLGGPAGLAPCNSRGLFCAVTRNSREGTPAGGWFPKLAASVESALRRYTTDAAWAGFGERERGSIGVGKRADLVVLSRDVFAGPPEEILRTRVLLTLFEGKPVWRDPAFR